MDYIFYSSPVNDDVPTTLMRSGRSELCFESALDEIPSKVRDYIYNHSDEEFMFVLQVMR